MGYKIIVNGEKVWESEQDAIAVDYVSVSTSRGEMGRLYSAADNTELMIEVNIRDKNFTDNLDMLDEERAQARRDRLEEYANSGDMIESRPNTETVAGAEAVYGSNDTEEEEETNNDLDLGSFSTTENEKANDEL